MRAIHLRQPGFTYSACGQFTKSKGRIQKFRGREDSRCIYQNKLDKACFQHDITYGDFKDIDRRTASDKILCDIAQMVLLQWFISFLMKKLLVEPLRLQINLQ